MTQDTEQFWEDDESWEYEPSLGWRELIFFLLGFIMAIALVLLIEFVRFMEL